MACDICKIEENLLVKFTRYNKEYHLCNWCQDRMIEIINGSINRSVVNIHWGFGHLGFSCWVKIRDFIRKNNIKEVLEFGTGLSTELFINEGLKVTTLDDLEQHSRLYAEHEWVGKNANLLYYEADEIPEFDHAWDFVFVDGGQERSRQVRHALKYATKWLMLHDPKMGEESFFPNNDWVEVEDKIWERKVPLSKLGCNGLILPLTDEELPIILELPFKIPEIPDKLVFPDCSSMTEVIKLEEPKIKEVKIDWGTPPNLEDLKIQVLSQNPSLAGVELPKSQNRSQYAFIVSSCHKYVPELCACLNSLDYVGNTQDVYVLGYQLPQYFVDQFSKLNYNVYHYDIPEKEARQYDGESEILCRKRYWYAAEYGQNYDAMCVLDADMYFCTTVDQFFKIAAKTGFILGATLEQKRVYGGIEHHKIKGKQVLPHPVLNTRDICCAPMFVDMKKYGDLFRECWTIFSDGFPIDNFKAPDMESYNLLILKYGLTDQIICLPNHCWVGTNEKFLKPYNRAVIREEGVYTESGEPIFIVHGQWYKQRWRQVQLDNRHNCAAGYLKATECSDNMARASLECLYEKFKQMLDWKMVVEKKAYTGSGDPGTSLI